MINLTVHTKSRGVKGFKLTFENGVTVSIQMGYDNYCENHFKKRMKRTIEHAEVGAWDKHGKWITKKYRKNKCGDTVIPWAKADQIADFIYWAKNYKSI